MFSRLILSSTASVTFLLGGCAQTSAQADRGTEEPTATGQEPATTEPEPTARTQPRGMGGGTGGMQGAQMCPASIEGADVTAVDVEGGVALEFTTRAGDTDDVREQVQAMAARHNQRMEQREERQAAGRGMGMRGMPMSSASVQELPNGARLIYRVEDEAQLSELRDAARQRVSAMEAGTCPRDLMGSAG